MMMLESILKCLRARMVSFSLSSIGQTKLFINSKEDDIIFCTFLTGVKILFLIPSPERN